MDLSEELFRKPQHGVRDDSPSFRQSPILTKTLARMSSTAKLGAIIFPLQDLRNTTANLIAGKIRGREYQLVCHMDHGLMVRVGPD